MKRKLKNLVPYFTYFYRYLGYRLFLLLLVSIVVAIMDGLGLAMFLPMLELVASSEATASAEQMGRLGFVIEWMNSLGWQLTLTVVLSMMFTFFLLKGVGLWLMNYLAVIYKQYFIRNLRIENIDALSEYGYEAFVKSDAGRIQNALSGEAERVVQAYNSYNQMIRQMMMALTYAMLAFLSNPGFAVLVMIGGVATNFLFNTLYTRTKILSKELVKSNSDFQGLLIQEVAFFKYLNATALISHYARNLRKKVYEIEHSVRKMGAIHSLMIGIREPLMIGIVIVVILIQVQVFGGNLATIILSILFFYRAHTSVMLTQNHYNYFLSYSGSMAGMKEFLTELRKHKLQTGERELTTFREKISVQDLSFRYGDAPYILRDIDFTFYRNETLALVGESGSGKTTLMNILSGLLQPSRGRLLIDGVDSRDINLRSLQRKIGYITQEPVVFDDTIFNNVTFWADPTPENIRKFEDALRKANLDGLLASLPDGINSRLGSNGLKLSGGQRQRISIARELYKEVEFLFMDEATSALDSETELAIQHNIDQLKGQYTILIIAHRLSTIKNADRVIVLKKGRIDKIGSYHELISTSSTFQRMVALQEL